MVEDMYEGRRPGEFLYNIWLPEYQMEVEFVLPNELRFKDWDDIEAQYLQRKLREDENARLRAEEAELQHRYAEQLYRGDMGQPVNVGRQRVARSRTKLVRARGDRNRASRPLDPPVAAAWGRFLADYTYALRDDKNKKDEADLNVEALPEISKAVWGNQPNPDEKEELDTKIPEYEHMNPTRGPNVQRQTNRVDVADSQGKFMKSLARGRAPDNAIRIPNNVVFDIERLRDLSQERSVNFNIIL